MALDVRSRVEAACAVLGVDAAGARLVKFTNNIVVEIPASEIVIRIAGSAALHHRVPKVVDVARWLERESFPAVRLHPDFPNPVAVAGDLATVWVREAGVDRPATTTDLGHLLHRFHRLPDPPDALPGFDPIADIRVRLARAEHVTREDLDFLHARCDELADHLRRARFPLPPGPIHGDAHVGNVIVTPSGPVLADFDSTSTGPREWDLVPVLFGVERFGDPAANAALLSEAYGLDITKGLGMDVLLRIREVRLAHQCHPRPGCEPRPPGPAPCAHDLDQAW